MRIRAVVSGVLVVAVVAVVAVPAGAAARILGGGSSFVALAMDRWTSDVGRPPLSLAVDYQLSGSTQGRADFVSGRLDFAATDVPYGIEEARPTRPFTYVPIVAGGLAFAYNLTGLDGQRISELKLDGPTVCRIFTEPGMRWDDPALVALNPALAPALPATPVAPVVRDEPAGTSATLSAFCIAAAPGVWRSFQALVAGTQPLEPEFARGLPTSDWPRFEGAGTAFGDDGVGDVVAQSYDGINGKIGYVGYGAALVRSLPVAAMRTGSGTFVRPEGENVAAALSYATADPAAPGLISLPPSAPDPLAYFPAIVSYVIAPLDGDPQKRETLTRFLCYAITDGQRAMPSLGYVPLSTQIAEIARAQVARLPSASGACAPAPPPVVPEAPLGALLGVAALGAVGLATAISRRRLSSTGSTTLAA